MTNITTESIAQEFNKWLTGAWLSRVKEGLRHIVSNEATWSVFYTPNTSLPKVISDERRAHVEAAVLENGLFQKQGFGLRGSIVSCKNGTITITARDSAARSYLEGEVKRMRALAAALCETTPLSSV